MNLEAHLFPGHLRPGLQPGNYTNSLTKTFYYYILLIRMQSRGGSPI